MGIIFKEGKAFMLWETKYSVGVKKIDDQHKKLFDMINKIHKAHGTDEAPKKVKEIIKDMTDYVGYHNEFLKLFGFGVDGIDYDEDLSPEIDINNLS